MHISIYRQTIRKLIANSILDENEETLSKFNKSSLKLHIRFALREERYTGRPSRR
jgi:hypothetical protein